MPTVVEIHPPFADYTDWPGFLTAYQPFEQALLSRWPAVRILMENRAGTQYRAPFLLSRPIDFITLARLIRERSLRLRITWDIPQLFTALNSRPSSMQADLYAIAPALEWIDGIHL